MNLDDVDRLIANYCQRHGIPPSRAYSAWMGRRHPQLVRFAMARAMIAKGHADQIPDGLLDGSNELPPLKSAERYRRAGERRRAWGMVSYSPR